MAHQIYKKEGGNLIITVPLKSRRTNPWDEDFNEEMNNIIGLYQREYENGLCYAIDMDYAAKPDQWTDYFFKLNGTLEEFEAMCNYLDIDYVIEPEA